MELIMQVIFSCPMESEIAFGEWLLLELEKNNWSQAELARRAGLEKPTISRILSGTRGIGSKVSNAIADALNYPPTFVAQMAGILPPVKDKDPTDEELLHLYNQLSEEEQEEIRKWVRFKVEENKKK